MPKADPILARLRKICLSLPDTTEKMAWGHPTFRVVGKMFAGYEEIQGKMAVGFKLEVPHAELRMQDPRFIQSVQFRTHRWVSMDAAQIDDWDDVHEMIMEGYRLAAPKKMLAKLEGAHPSRGHA